MKVTIPGYTSLTGSPVAILQAMQDARLFNHLDGDDYIKEVTHAAWRFFGTDLQVTGDTYPERCESLLRELDRTHMIYIEEEN